MLQKDVVLSKQVLFRRRAHDIPASASYNINQYVPTQGMELPITSIERADEINTYAKYVAREQLLREVHLSLNEDGEFRYNPPDPLLELTEDEVQNVIMDVLTQADERETTKEVLATDAALRAADAFTTDGSTTDPRNLDYDYELDYAVDDFDMENVFE